MRIVSSVADDVGTVDRLTYTAMMAAGLASREDALIRVDDVLRLAEDWAIGGVPLVEVRRLTSPQERFLAARLVRPMPRSFAWLLDALIVDDMTDRYGQHYQTKHGAFSDTELRDIKARVTKPDGRVRILFPIRHPWLVPPERDEKGRVVKDGTPGPPLYAETVKERRRIANESERAPGAKRLSDSFGL